MTVSDALQRQQALDISKSFIVQAPAGSGKTGVLTQRILKLLAVVDRPEQILAITFTKKAAAEMRARVINALHDAESGILPNSEHEQTYQKLASAALARDRQQGWNILQNPARLRMQTIDSLCSSLVKDNLLSAALGAKFSVDEDSGMLYLEATNNLLASLDDKDDVSQALFRILQTYDNQYSRVQNLIVQMLGQRDHWLRDIMDAKQDWAHFRELVIQSLQALNESHEKKILANLSPGDKPEMAALTTYAINNLHANNPDHSLLACEPGSFAFRKQQFRLFMTAEKEWRKSLDVRCGFPSEKAAKGVITYKTRAKELLDRFGSLGDEFLADVVAFINLPDPELSQEEWALLEDLAHVVYFAAIHLQMIFQQRKTIDFSGVAQAAISALGSDEYPTDSLLSMDERIAHILVDEFQDTSFGQIELLEKLTQGWLQGDGRTLFLVGDPMQSIYAFRKAEVGLFLRLWETGKLGSNVELEQLSLCTNFRSSQTVLDWINDVFAHTFPKTDNSRTGAVRYARSVPHKTNSSNDLVKVQIFTGEENADLAEAEADWIADEISRLPETQSVAILIKGKSHILHIAAALRKRGIAYQAVDIESLAESQIILDLSSLLKICLSPGDRVSWFAMLRGPWCGLELVELEQIAQADSHPWLALQKACSNAEIKISELARNKICHLRDVACRFYQHRLQQPFVEALRQAALDLMLASTAKTQADADAMELFFDLLADIPAMGGIPDDVILQRKLAKLFVPPESLADNQRKVQVMTMHKSKGLEFDVVFLPQLQRKGKNDDQPLILTEKQTGFLEAEQEFFMAPVPPKRGKDEKRHGVSVYDYLWSNHKGRMSNERARLLYVACTRAKSRLYLTACLTLKKSGDGLSNPDSASLLKTIYSHVENNASMMPVDSRQILNNPGAFRRLDRAPASLLMPKSAAGPKLKTESKSETGQGAPDIHRASGILMHKILEVWARNPTRIPDAITGQQQKDWQRQLERQGFDSSLSTQGADWIARALNNLLNNEERRRWLLETPHQDAHAEYAISSTGEQGVQHWIIDRTFVENGVRHIIDYKLTGTDDNIDEFLAEEIARYKPQLDNYCNILTARDGMPCRAYLYFPLLDQLHEVEP